VPSAVIDNPKYIEAILIFGVPSTVQKVSTVLRLNPISVRLFSDINGMRTTLKAITF